MLLRNEQPRYMIKYSDHQLHKFNVLNEMIL